MIQKLKRQILVLASLLMFAMPALVPLSVSAACEGNIQDNVAKGVQGSTGVPTTCDEKDGTQGSTVNKLAKNVVNIFSLVVGAVAIIMIIYGGFRYITSGGDSGNVGNAKNTLIYAIVGLVIVVLAQVIVQFVLAQSSNAGQGL